MATGRVTGGKLARALSALLLALCLMAGLSACSSTTFVYNRLDFLLPWYIGDYVALDREQEQFLDSRLASFLRWHRGEELPDYVRIIDDIEVRLDRRLTAADIAGVFAEFERAWLRTEGEALDWMLELGDRLSDEQVDDFIAELWQRQREFEEEYLERSDREFYADSYDNMKDSAGDFLGRLSPEQKEYLQAEAGKLLRSDQAWLDERAAWLLELEALLQREPGWQEEMRAAIVRRRDNPSPEYLRVYEHNLDVVNRAVAGLLNERSDRQDRHLRNKLDDLRDDLETLVAQGAEKAPADSA